MPLVLCRSCSRHILEDGSACPFCGAAVGAVETRALPASSSLSGLSALALAALSLTTAHCQDAPPSEKRAERPPLPSSLPVSSPPAPSDSGIPRLSPDEAARREPLMRALNDPGRESRPVYGAPQQPVRKRPAAIIHSINTQGHERAGAERVIRGMLLAFLNCYKRAIKKHPRLEGRVVSTIDVDASGTVTQVQVDPISPDRRSIVPCLTAEVQQAAFASSDGPSVITFDMTLSLPRKGPRDPLLDPDAGNF